MDIIKMRYLTEPRDRRYVKGYGFLPFAKNIGKNISSKYSQKLVDRPKKSAADTVKTASKRAIQKTAETTGDSIGNKITDKITSVLKSSSRALHLKDCHQMKLIMKYQKKNIYLHKRYSDAYIIVNGTITVNNTAAADADANNTNEKVIFKNCVSFTNCISEINNIQVDHAKDIDIVMPMYNLIEYSDNYSKTSGSLWQYCKDIPAVDNNNAIVNFAEDNLTDSFNFKVKITDQTVDD